jgi:trehalose synthase
VREIAVSPIRPERLEAVLATDRVERFHALAAHARELLGGRVIWNVSSTAGGGGVAEMLQRFLRYVLGAGVDCRWIVIDANPQFFEVTKRTHNLLHDAPGDGGELDDRARDVYEKVIEASARELLPQLGDGDVVILHDPQVVGLAPRLREQGTLAVWRCHVGTDEATDRTRHAWEFLRPWIDAAPLVVFSRRVYAPEWLDSERVRVIAPAIDPLSPKNQPLADHQVLAILGAAGVIGVDAAEAVFQGSNDEQRTVDCRVRVIGEGRPLGADTPMLTQVSRWDHLKDMAGVMRGFVEGGVARATGAHLLLVGPDVSGVGDDPEGQQVLDECTSAWQALPAGDRATVSLVVVPMDDADQNAVIVNALQRHARVVVQKSLEEGFGLTVAEAMWKGRPVVASAVGGIQDQVRDGVDGLLLPRPDDLSAFADAARALLEDPARAERMGASGHERVKDQYLADRDLGQWMALLEELDG